MPKTEPSAPTAFDILQVEASVLYDIWPKVAPNSIRRIQVSCDRNYLFSFLFDKTSCLNILSDCKSTISKWNVARQYFVEDDVISFEIILQNC